VNEKMKKGNSLIIGLDIGTTKTCVVVGEANGETVDIIGVGSYPSRGLRKGMVINVESTVDSIRKAVEEAELMAGCEIASVYTGISGGHVRGINSQGVVALKNGEVGEADVKKVIEAAKAVVTPWDREVIHILPQEFIVDNQTGIQEPIGMSGVRLEAKVHIVTGSTASAQNIFRCANQSGLNVADLILQPLASSKAALSPDEQELGVALVDIGGGTTDIAIFHGGSIKYTSVLPLGGNHITHDIAIGLRTPIKEAEKIKKKYGCAYSSLIQKDETIEVPDIGGRKPKSLLRKTLGEIIAPRVEEILNLVRLEIIKSGYNDFITSGLVLTGGSVILEGVPELAEEIFNLPARRGCPIGIGGLKDVVNSPMYATGVGLVLWNSKNHASNGLNGKNFFTKAVTWMKGWFEEFF
jgi:cell division protein FtsA